MPTRILRPLLVATGRNPFEIAILTAAVTGAVTSLISGVSPQSVLASMSPLIQGLWQAELLAGGVIGLTGALWAGSLFTSLRVESIGVLILGAATSMYAVAIVAASGLSGVVAGSFVISIALACWARCALIVRDIHRARRAARAGTTTDVTLLAEKR